MNPKIFTLQLQVRCSRERPWPRWQQNIRKDIKQKEGSWWKENEELGGGKIQAEEEAWLLQDQTNEKAVKCYSKVSCSKIYLTTFNDGPPSTEYQQRAMAQVVGCQHCGSLGSIPNPSMCDLWWTKWHCDRPVSQYFGPPLPSSFNQCYTLIHSYIHPSMTATT